MGNPFIQRVTKPESLFLLLATTFGLLFCLGTAPFQVPDEFVHFYRAYQVSELKFLPEYQSDYAVGGQLPESFSLFEDAFLGMTTKPKSTASISSLEALLKEPLNPHQTTFFSFKNSAIYAPVGYLPQALGLLIGRWLHVSLLAEFYLGRIFNLLVWTALTYLALRVAPFFKWVLFVFGLMPMTISQAASLSVDGLLNGAAFLFIALILRAASEKGPKPGWKDCGVWIVLLTAVTLIKPAYIVLGALLFLVPVRKYGSWKAFLLALTLAAGVPVLAYLGWTRLLAWHEVSMSYDPLFNPSQQTHWIMSNFQLYVQTLVRNYGRMALPLLVSSIGYFGWLNQPQPAFVYPLFILFGFYTILLDHHPDYQVLLWQRIVILGVILAGLITIASGIYIVSNPVAYQRIDGIQGRYFIPLEPLFGLLIYNHVIRFRAWILNILIPLCSVIFLVIALQTVLQRIQF